MKSAILIFSAIQSELSGLFDEMTQPNILEVSELKVISGDLRNVSVCLLASGPGLVNTAYALTKVISVFHPSLLIETGCGGGFRQSGVQVGDICIATEEIDAQLGIESIADDGVIHDLPFPVFQKNGCDFKHRYALDLRLAELSYAIVRQTLDPSCCTLHKGTFVTVSTITATDLRADLLYQSYRPCMESMEGSAAAHVSILQNIPLLEIRSASNLVGRRDKSAWNLPLSFQRCALAILTLLESNEFMTWLKLNSNSNCQSFHNYSGS